MPPRKKATTATAEPRVAKPRAAKKAPPSEPKPVKPRKKTVPKKSPNDVADVAAPAPSEPKPVKPRKITVKKSPKDVADVAAAAEPKAEFALDGFSIDRTSVEQLDRECAGKYGAEFVFDGTNCAHQSERTKKERDSLLKELKRAGELGEKIRDLSKKCEREFQACSALMLEAETHAEKPHLVRSQIEYYTTIGSLIAKTAASLLYRIEICTRHDDWRNMKKFEEGCFNSHHMTRSNQYAEEVIDILTKFMAITNARKKHFALTFGQKIVKAAKNVAAYAKKIAAGVLKAFKFVVVLAMRNAKKIIVTTAIVTVFPAIMTPILMNNSALFQGVNVGCNVFVAFSKCMENRVVLTGMLMVFLQMRHTIPMWTEMEDVMRGMIASKFEKQMPRGGNLLKMANEMRHNKMLELSKKADKAISDSERRSIDADIDKQLSEQVHKSEMSKAMVTTGAEVVSMTCIFSLASLFPVLQTCGGVLAWATSKFCGGMQATTGTLSEYWGQLKSRIGVSPETVWGDFISPGAITKMLLSACSEAAVEEFRGKTAHAIFRILENGGEADTRWISFFGAEAIDPEELEKLGIKKGLYRSKQDDIKKQIIQMLKSNEEKDLARVRKIMTMMIIAFVAMGLVWLVYTYISSQRSQDPDDFFDALETKELSSAQAMELLRVDLDHSRTLIAKLDACMSGVASACVL